MAGVRSMGRIAAAKLRGTSGDASWAAVGEDWFRTLGEMKGAAMKLGQLASQYADVLPPGLAGPLARLQKDAVARPFAQMKRVLDAQWSVDQWAAVATLQPVALAAASIGQVHRAQLQDGRQVVIKIRYPGVAESVDEDIIALGRLLRMGKVLPVDGKALDGLLDEVRVRFREETDYTREHAYLQAMRQHAVWPGVGYPVPVPALCTQGVFVTEWAPADDIETALTYPPAVRDQIGTRLLGWLLQQVLVGGWVHADPHPGNFGFHPDGRITVYDFGCVREVSEAHQAQMRRIARSLETQNWAVLHEAVHALGGLARASDDAQVRSALLDNMRPHYEALAAVGTDRLFAERPFNFGDAALIEDTRRVARQEIVRWLRDYRPIPPLAFVGRALSGQYWLLRRLGARVDVPSVLPAARLKEEKLSVSNSVASRFIACLRHRLRGK